jgi:hypothetical protein
MYALKVYANHYLEKVISPKEYACMVADEVDASYNYREHFNQYLAEHLELTHEEVFDFTEEDKARTLVDYKAWLAPVVEAELLAEGWEAVVLHIEQSDLTYVGEDISDEADEPAPAEAPADTAEDTDNAVAN